MGHILNLLIHFAKIIEEIPLGRSGNVNDIANAVQFLFESTHISGQIINVDGGWSLNQKLGV